MYETIKDEEMYHGYINQFEINYPIYLPIEVDNPEGEDRIEGAGEVISDRVIINSKQDLEALALEMDGLLIEAYHLKTFRLGRIEIGIINNVSFDCLKDIDKFKYFFKTQQSDLKQYNYQLIKVNGMLDPEEVDYEMTMMYEIEFKSGKTIHAFEDEIFLKED